MANDWNNSKKALHFWAVFHCTLNLIVSSIASSCTCILAYRKKAVEQPWTSKFQQTPTLSNTNLPYKNSGCRIFHPNNNDIHKLIIIFIGYDWLKSNNHWNRLYNRDNPTMSKGQCHNCDILNRIGHSPHRLEQYQSFRHET
jgi:hypothetical protein